MNKKKIGIIIVFAILVIAIVVSIFIFKGGFGEKKLISNLEKLGKKYYEEIYYPSQGASDSERVEFIKNYEKTGLSIDLDNISKNESIDQDLVKSLYNKKTNKKCDDKKTTVTYYPVKPYGKTDYKIKVNLECGF